MAAKKKSPVKVLRLTRDLAELKKGPLTRKFRAFKVVDQRTLHGPSYGGVKYEPGHVVFPQAMIERAWEQAERTYLTCEAGLNIATKQWCRKQYGNRGWCNMVMLVEFTRRDVICVPEADGKFRVMRCLVVGKAEDHGEGTVI